jgi:hypothetical protein
MTGALVDDFPPARARLVTLANWRQAPFSAWSFRNVRRLIPTVNIAASGHMTALELALEEIGHKARRSVSLCLDQYRRARLGVYERACERAYADILSEYLWTPLGAEHDAYITIDARNAMRAAGGICASPHDLARFAEMIRRRGVADGRQVVPGAWIDDITASGSTSTPEAELVIIRMASEATPLDLDRVRGWRRGFDAIAEYFL